MFFAAIYSFMFVENEFYFVFVGLAVAGTLFIDSLDHALYVLFSKEKLAKDNRRLLFKGRVIAAYNDHKKRRKKEIKKVVFHNWYFIAMLVILSVYVFIINNQHLISIVVFGFLLHFLTDLFEDIVLGKNKKFWSIRFK
jgi:hypothetical protein